MLIALLLAVSAVATPIPLDTAKRIFEETRLAAEEEGGRLWGVPLYGPMMFVDPATRFAVTNQPDAEGLLVRNGDVYTGTLPQSVILANTAADWGGTRWTMVLWPGISARVVPRRRLLFHESWHRIQDSIGLTAKDKPIAELESAEGRYWLQLEVRALAAALKSSGDDRAAAIRDAIAFRAKRRSLFDSLAEAERALEANEGLAEYTGFAMRGTTDAESRLALARALESLDRNTSFARSFAYYTGPAYGLLLDSSSPGWTRRFTPASDLAHLLASATAVQPAATDAEKRAAAYGGAELLAFETKRDADRREQIARQRALFVDGPVLELPMANANFGFDPTRVIPLDGVGSVHPTLDVTADWGTLKATGGALITSDFSRIIVPAPATAGENPTTLQGNGWTVSLVPGWRAVAGARAGDWRVVRDEH